MGFCSHVRSALCTGPVRDLSGVALARTGPGVPVVPRTNPVRDQSGNVIWALIGGSSHFFKIGFLLHFYNRWMQLENTNIHPKSEKQLEKGDPRIFCAYPPRNEPPTTDMFPFTTAPFPWPLLSLLDFGSPDVDCNWLPHLPITMYWCLLGSWCLYRRLQCEQGLGGKRHLNPVWAPLFWLTHAPWRQNGGQRNDFCFPFLKIRKSPPIRPSTGVPLVYDDTWTGCGPIEASKMRVRVCTPGCELFKNNFLTDGSREFERRKWHPDHQIKEGAYRDLKTWARLTYNNPDYNSPLVIWVLEGMAPWHFYFTVIVVA